MVCWSAASSVLDQCPDLSPSVGAFHPVFETSRAALVVVVKPPALEDDDEELEEPEALEELEEEEEEAGAADLACPPPSCSKARPRVEAAAAAISLALGSPGGAFERFEPPSPPLPARERFFPSFLPIVERCIPSTLLCGSALALSLRLPS